MRPIDHLLAVLGCPLAKDEAIAQLISMARTECIAQFEQWLLRLCELNPSAQFEELLSDDVHVYGRLKTNGETSSVAYRFIDEKDLAAFAEAEGPAAAAGVAGSDITVVCIVADPGKPDVVENTCALVASAGEVAPHMIVMEPAWLAAAVVRQSKPLSFEAVEWAGEGRVSPAPYFDRSSPADDRGPVVTRVRSSLRTAVGGAMFLEPHSLAEKVMAGRPDVEEGEGDIFLATTYLPPVTQSVNAIARYYAKIAGDPTTVLSLVRQRQDAQRAGWIRHIRRFRRYELLDRQQLEEYFLAPEYYQMRLTPDEVDEQVENWIGLFDYDNYVVALVPDAIDIAFSLRGSRVHLRGDRRNKSEPRPGRVNGLVLRDERLAADFLRESWTLLESTEQEFRDKAFIKGWVRNAADVYRRLATRGRS
jgi:hypothetical protein